MLGVAACLALVGALVLPATAETQTANIYTSNLGEDTDGYQLLASYADGIAQGFHTGDRSAGYKLDNVQIRIRKASDSTRNADVWLREKSSSGGPGDVIFKFVDRDIKKRVRHLLLLHRADR